MNTCRGSTDGTWAKFEEGIGDEGQKDDDRTDGPLFISSACSCQGDWLVIVRSDRNFGRSSNIRENWTRCGVSLLNLSSTSYPPVWRGDALRRSYTSFAPRGLSMQK